MSPTTKPCKNRTWPSTWAVLGISALFLTGCSGEPAPDSAAETSSVQETDNTSKVSGDSKKQSGDGLPEDFPQDVPVPEFTSVKKIGGESGPDVNSDWWSIKVMLKGSTQTPVEDYAAQLSDAGYTVSTDSGTTVAVGPNWEISFHSSMEGTLTVGVISK